MTSRDATARVRMRADEYTFVGPRDLRRPERQPIVDLRDGSNSPSTRSGVEITVTPRSQREGGYDVGPLDSGPGWRERDRSRTWRDPKVRVSYDEYDRILRDYYSGGWKKAARDAWRIARKAARGKDARIDIMLSILEAVLPEGLRDLLPASGVTWPAGWTVTAKCDDVEPEFGSSAMWTAGGCLYNQAGVGNNGMGPHVIAQSATWYRLGLGLFARNQANGRAHHYQSGWSPNLPKPWTPDVPLPTWNKPKPIADMRGRFPYPSNSARPGHTQSMRDMRPPGRGAPTAGMENDPLPKPNLKDRKFRVSIDSGSALGRALGTITEGYDLVDVAYNSLGKKCWGANDIASKAKCVAKNFHTMDWDKFARGFVENQIEDYLYGKLGRISAKAANKARRSTGWQMGPWDTAGGQYSRWIDIG